MTRRNAKIAMVVLGFMSTVFNLLQRWEVGSFLFGIVLGIALCIWDLPIAYVNGRPVDPRYNRNCRVCGAAVEPGGICLSCGTKAEEEEDERVREAATDVP